MGLTMYSNRIIYIYSHCLLPHTMPFTERILRLGLNNFQSKAECGKAGKVSQPREVGGAKTV